MRGQSEYDCTMKILMLGNSGAGKSCLLMRFTDNKFVTNYYNTIGVDYKLKVIDIDGYHVKMQLWDTAGQDRFKNITNSYYRGADGIIVVYDITDRGSFEGVQGWLTQIEKYADPDIKKMVVGNKTDLNQRRQVPTSEAAKIAKTLNLPFIETSARDGNNVQDAYIQMAAKEIINSNKGNPKTKNQLNRKKKKPKIVAADQNQQCC